MVGHGILLCHLQHFAVRGGITDDALLTYFFPSCLELRFHKADAHRIRRTDLVCHRENMLERDKRDINAEECNRFCKVFRLYIADVGAFHIDNTGIGAQAPGKLPVAHIHRIHLDRAVLQHAVGETTGGSTDIHADFSVRPHGKHLHGLFQLQSASAHIADIMPAHFHLGIFRDHLTGFVHLLLVDKHNARHDQRLGPFSALYQAVLAQILIQPDLAHT